MSARVTRSQSKQQKRQSDPTALTEVPGNQPTRFSYTGTDIATLPEVLVPNRTGTGKKAIRLLKLKQHKLRDAQGQVPTFIKQLDGTALALAAEATLVFAQEEAGTAVCISSTGLLLTCSHCIAENEESLDREQSHWLLFASGHVVHAKCVAWDGKQDLALLKIIAAQSPAANTSSADGSSTVEGFPSVNLAPSPPKHNTELLCIGHPGSEDLEVEHPGTKTGYDVLHISKGNFRGLDAGQDPHDNSEIGALKHDCWTYWGHSGAPLLDGEGRLIGLHSSWDDSTGMRRGIAWEALQAFLEEHAILEYRP